MKIVIETHADYIEVALERNDCTKGIAIKGASSAWMGYGMSNEELALCKRMGEDVLNAELEGE